MCSNLCQYLLGVENTVKPWHAVDADDVMRALNVTCDGLTSQEAQQRLEEYGYNELKEKKTALQMFLEEPSFSAVAKKI
jgi:magnesium-transporting ATPase (P-type)